MELKDASLLVLDDMPGNIALLRGILANSGYRNVVAFTNGYEACQYCEENTVDLILLDLMMPEMDGFQVLERLKASLKEWMPLVLVLTAVDDREVCLKALESGARDLLTKPLNHYEVQARVRNLLEISIFQKKLNNQNMILEQQVRERTRQLYETQLEIVARLGRAAEYRENETGLHTIRMSHYSRILAFAAGFSENDADLLFQAAPMHDIGKIGVPDGILLKKGRLDEHEWETMKTHAEVGAKILAGSSTRLMEWAEIIAFTHHERWDGTGYPRGLKGEDIPLIGRIVAVADVFDALTTARPYKAAWTVEEALDHLKKERGKHFEGRLVDLFLEHLPEMLSIKEIFSEKANEQNYVWRSDYLSLSSPE